MSDHIEYSKHNGNDSWLTDKQILMRLYTVTVYNLTVCMMQDNPGSKHLKGDNK